MAGRAAAIVTWALLKETKVEALMFNIEFMDDQKVLVIMLGPTKMIGRRGGVIQIPPRPMPRHMRCYVWPCRRTLRHICFECRRGMCRHHTYECEYCLVALCWWCCDWHRCDQEADAGALGVAGKFGCLCSVGGDEWRPLCPVKLAKEVVKIRFQGKAQSEDPVFVDANGEVSVKDDWGTTLQSMFTPCGGAVTEHGVEGPKQLSCLEARRQPCDAPQCNEFAVLQCPHCDRSMCRGHWWRCAFCAGDGGTCVWCEDRHRCQNEPQVLLPQETLLMTGSEVRSVTYGAGWPGCCMVQQCDLYPHWGCCDCWSGLCNIHVEFCSVCFAPVCMPCWQYHQCDQWAHMISDGAISEAASPTAHEVPPCHHCGGDCYLKPCATCGF